MREPYYRTSKGVLYQGDCLLVMKEMPDAVVDTIITDPPYGLEFMGEDWDRGVPGVAFWVEMLRVAKPGALLLSFGGTRTWHRLACAIEDAGWIIRDTVAWVYGSGFPKSMDISKAIDAAKGLEREVVAENPNVRPNCNPEDNTLYHYGATGKTGGITIPASPEAKLWDGWGTSLKPAFEPIVMAMKPLDGTFVENALKWGVAGLNIRGGRIPVDPAVDDMLRETTRVKRVSETWEKGSGFKNETNNLTGVPAEGRFPSNLIHDGSKEVLACFPESEAQGHWAKSKITGFGERGGGKTEYFGVGPKDTAGGSVARFFYCAKASDSEREEGCEGLPAKPNENTTAHNHHPTVKPIALMEYLAKLTQIPTGGIVLDPFIGSGTTALACERLNRRWIGIELSQDYCEIAKARLGKWKMQHRLDQFDGGENHDNP